MNKIVKLNRFTTLPVLLDILERKKLVLLNPDTWEDKNDIEVINEFKKRINYSSLFALCFTHADETIHHWKYFSNGISGCCIEFNAKKLFEIIRKDKNFIHRRVSYKKIEDIEGKPIRKNQMPFIKRWPYRCENEYRILWIGNTDRKSIEIDIQLDMINKITFSQNMPEPIYQTIKKQLKKVNIDSKTIINWSTVFENKRWIECFKDPKKKSEEKSARKEKDSRFGTSPNS